MDYRITNFDREHWDQMVAQLPSSHVLQTWEWGAFKSQYGWEPTQIVWYDGDRIVAASLVLKRTLNIPIFSRFSKIYYMPKGPLFDWRNSNLRHQILKDLYDYAKSGEALFIKMDPDVVLATGLPVEPDEVIPSTDGTLLSDLMQHGWQFASEQIQFKNTVQIDLLPSEEILLAQMKQKTRYNIRLASRKGVTVRAGTDDDYALLYQMYAETSVRDNFTIRSEEYYKSAWGMFNPDNIRLDQATELIGHSLPVAEPLIAEVNGEPVAAVIIYRFAKKAWYMYGMSRAVHREKMPNYLLQWEAIRRSKSAGCQTYDLWGAPDAYDESDPLWKVYQFKEGFGGIVVRHLGAWDLPIKPAPYKIYNYVLPRILGLMRILGRKSTKQSILN
jgi:peptidoglycan pentaglycine glycine transferase (the first glycine)